MTKVEGEEESLAEDQSDAYFKMQEGEGHGSDQSEKPEDLLMNPLALMILSWQTTFKISDNAITVLQHTAEEMMNRFSSF